MIYEEQTQLLTTTCVQVCTSVYKCVQVATLQLKLTKRFVKREQIREGRRDNSRDIPTHSQQQITRPTRASG